MSPPCTTTAPSGRFLFIRIGFGSRPVFLPRVPLCLFVSKCVCATAVDMFVCFPLIAALLKASCDF